MRTSGALRRADFAILAGCVVAGAVVGAPGIARAASVVTLPGSAAPTVLAGTVALGVVAHAIVGAISSSATAGSPGSTGWIGSAVSHWAIVPANAATYGNILVVVIICCVIALVRVEGVRRLALIVVTVYLGACCWEARLIVNPAITTQIMIGAILIVTMAVRPNGLLGRRRVEIV